MHEFKIMMTLSMMVFFILIDIYTWQAFKILFNNKSAQFIKRSKRFYFGATLFFAILFLMQLWIPYFESNKLFKVYTGAFVFVIYLSKFLVVIFLLVEDIQRLIRWVIKKITSTLTTNSAVESVTIKSVVQNLFHKPER